MAKGILKFSVTVTNNNLEEDKVTILKNCPQEVLKLALLKELRGVYPADGITLDSLNMEVID